MSIKNIVIGFFLISSITLGVSQDIHFTQFDRAELNVNPAYTGNFEGTVRVNGIYRDQFRADGSAYDTYNLSLEANLPFAFRKQDWIAGGIKMYGDKSGSLEQEMSLYALNLAYHLSFDKEQTSILTLGAQYGTGGIEYGNINGSAEPLLGNNSPNASAIRDENEKYIGGELNDLMIGTLYTNKGEKSLFNLGVSVEGLLSPDRAAEKSTTPGQDPGTGGGSIPRGTDEKSIGISVSSQFTSMINEKSSWTAAAWYYSLGSANALNVHGKYSFLVEPEQDIWLSLGAGTRSLNSLVFLAGIKISDIDVGLAYDWTISDLSNRSSYGAIELGVTYIYKHYKKPEPKPLIFCPRL